MHPNIQVTSDKSFKINFGWFECFYAFYYDSKAYKCHTISDLDTINEIDQVKFNTRNKESQVSLYFNHN